MRLCDIKRVRRSAQVWWRNFWLLRPSKILVYFFPKIGPNFFRPHAMSFTPKLETPQPSDPRLGFLPFSFAWLTSRKSVNLSRLVLKTRWFIDPNCASENFCQSTRSTLMIWVNWRVFRSTAGLCVVTCSDNLKKKLIKR